MTDDEKAELRAEQARQRSARAMFDRAANLDIKHTLARAAELRRQACNTWHPCPNPALLLLEADALEARATALVLDAEPGDAAVDGLELVGEGANVRARIVTGPAPAPPAPDTIPSAPPTATLVDAQTFEARRLAGLQALAEAQAAMVGDGPHAAPSAGPDDEPTGDGAA